MKKYKLKNLISGNIVEVDETKLEILKENPALNPNGKFIFEILEEVKEEKVKKEKADKPSKEESK